jgi:hypothetical protein
MWIHFLVAHWCSHKKHVSASRRVSTPSHRSSPDQLDFNFGSGRIIYYHSLITWISQFNIALWKHVENPFLLKVKAYGNSHIVYISSLMLHSASQCGNALLALAAMASRSPKMIQVQLPSASRRQMHWQAWNSVPPWRNLVQMKCTATSEEPSANNGYHCKSSELQAKKNYLVHGSPVQLTTSKCQLELAVLSAR